MEKWREDGVIEPSDNNYSLAPVLVEKSDGTYSICIEYQDINAQTVKDAYPVASMDSILDKLRGAKYISKIDLKNAYLQVPIKQHSKKNTAFTVPGKGGKCLYQFVTMHFGLTNAPATFYRLVDALFGPEFEPDVFDT